MNYFFESFMSDIVFDLRKNSRKLYIIGALIVTTVIFAIVFASRVNFPIHGCRYILTGLAAKKLSAFGFFIISILGIALWAALLFFLSYNEKLFKLWPFLFLLRIFIRTYDIILVLKFYFFSIFLSVLIFIIVDLIVFVLFVIIYFDMIEKSINLDRCGNIHLSKLVVYPLLILIILLTCLQTILVPLFII